MKRRLAIVLGQVLQIRDPLDEQIGPTDGFHQIHLLESELRIELDGPRERCGAVDVVPKSQQGMAPAQVPARIMRQIG